MILTPETASRFMRIALGHVGREYPHKLDHVMNTDADVLPPRALHPAFHGSFDWHSCVHGWWTLLTLRRLHTDLPEAAMVRERADETFAEDKLAAELAYLDRPNAGGFERPYGWGWLLYLHLEASRHADRPWAARLEPLARAFAARLGHYLGILTYPIRTGTHFNSSFALTLALEWADAFDGELAAKIRARAAAWFGKDEDCQAWEPGGDEFLSSALSEALLMRRSLGDAAFAEWFALFLPRLAERLPASLFTPAHVSDRSDGKIAHLDGLNLSRAWAWRQLAPAIGGGEGGGNARAIAIDAAERHLEAAMAHVEGDYMGEHWLASFALLALLAAPEPAG
ncbi:DUF2891 domain-containing protein [Novosphingobium sp. ST904]|uniref:DUF2891 domain-containing protein n=1 Tax=Novosphingobium sp. ST904 TaxID=1684385 RepID=UPI0010488541|nr:DUF2891 domain-containing protein [Novosphingobium sp. ST904]TCM36067.1 DUF2891 family protein [Novosphingobium sp. ST904]